MCFCSNDCHAVAIEPIKENRPGRISRAVWDLNERRMMVGVHRRADPFTALIFFCPGRLGLAFEKEMDTGY